MSTVDKALGVLALFSETRMSLGLSEAARLLDWDKATVQRYLASLEGQGFLEKDPLTRAYHLGPAVTRLAAVREITYPIETAVKNVAAKLVQDTGETTHISHIQDGGLSCVCIVETALRNTRVYIDPSEVLPLHVTASGMAYLAQLPEAVADRLLRHQFKHHQIETLQTYESAKAQIRRAAARGYAVADATFDYDVVGMATHVRNAAGEPCGSVAVATPTTRFNDEVEAKIAAFLLPAAEKISRIYGAMPSGVQQAAE